MDYKEKSAYVEPDGITYTNPKSGETIIVRADQAIPDGFVKKGGRKPRRKTRKSKKRSTMKFRKIR